MDDDIGGSGYSLEDLSAYLDRGRSPRIAAIERSAEAQAVLSAMENMRSLSRELVERDARRPVAESWYDEVMREVMREFRAGRDIPLRRPEGETELYVTEGALSELVRRVGDEVGGVLVGRVRLAQPEQYGPLQVRMTVSVRYGSPIAETVQRLRESVGAAVSRHGELRVSDVDVTVEEVHVDQEAR